MRFIYADPALMDNLGHPANTCRYVIRELGKCGIKAEVFGFRGIRPELQSELGAAAHFRAHTFAAYDPDPICGWLKVFDASTEMTREDLLHIPAINCNDLVYFNSAQPAQLMAIIHWLAGLPPERSPQVVVEFGSEPGLDIAMSPTGFSCSTRDPRRDPRAAFFRLAGSKISPHVQNQLHMMTFDRQTAIIFTELIQHPVGLLPLPHHAVAPLRRRGGDPLTVGVLGHQRPEKGYSLMPRIARRLLQERSQIRILAHNGGPEQMPDTQRACASSRHWIAASSSMSARRDRPCGRNFLAPRTSFFVLMIRTGSGPPIRRLRSKRWLMRFPSLDRRALRSKGYRAG